VKRSRLLAVFLLTTFLLYPNKLHIPVWHFKKCLAGELVIVLVHCVLCPFDARLLSTYLCTSVQTKQPTNIAISGISTYE